MKYPVWVRLVRLVLLCFVLGCMPALAAGDVAAVQTATVQAVVETPSTFERVVNSPLVVAIVSGLFLSLVTHLFTRNPAWVTYYDKYKGAFFDAVRAAERAIPDDTANVAMARADFAMKLLLRIEPALTNARAIDLQRGLSAAHDARKESDTTVISPVIVQNPPATPAPGGPI